MNASAYPYHLLNNALTLFQKAPAALSAEQLSQAKQRAERSYQLENLVLSAQCLAADEISDAEVDQALQTIRTRYASEQEFIADMAANGLDQASLKEALRRSLIFDQRMQSAGLGAEPVTDLDIRLYYELQRTQFMRPETRRVRHILITINEDYADNTRLAARVRINTLKQQLQGANQAAFEQAAKQHSECPTAVDGGMLGTVKAGQLYPELDKALFKLKAGGISPVLESELGFHLLYCEQIQPARTFPLEEVEHRVRELLESKRQHQAQKAWLQKLQDAAKVH